MTHYAASFTIHNIHRVTIENTTHSFFRTMIMAFYNERGEKVGECAVFSDKPLIVETLPDRTAL